MSRSYSCATCIEHSMQDSQQQAVLTEGPARFVTIKDGSKDCAALLITESFLDKLNDMFGYKRDLNIILGPATLAQTDLESIEDSIRIAKKSLESAEDETEKENIREYLAHQEPRRLKLLQRKDHLEQRSAALKREIDVCNDYANYVLKTAMESANILRLSKPVSYPRSLSEESVRIAEPQPVVSHNHKTRILSPEEIRRQAAYDELRDCWDHLDKVQRTFHEREQFYHEDLARYNQRCVNGSCRLARSEFDRRHLDHGMRVTRALIDAESLFDNAKEQLDALEGGLNPSSPSYDHRYDERVSTKQEQMPPPTFDRNFIEAWRADVSGSELDELPEIATTDIYDARLVDISDSMSARDCGEYRKKIDRWQQACGTHQRPDTHQSKRVCIRDHSLWQRHSA